MVISCLVLCFGICLGELKNCTKTSGPDTAYEATIHEIRSSCDLQIATYRKRFKGIHPLVSNDLSHEYRLFRLAQHLYCYLQTLYFSIEKDYNRAFFYKILKIKLKWFSYNIYLVIFERSLK
jgi:hypothetical protein